MKALEHLTRRTLTAVALTLALSVGLAGFSPATASACDKHAKKTTAQTTQADEGTEDTKASGLVHQGEAKVGDRTLCPVMGNEFEVTADSPSFEHNGQTIYFCCGGCSDGFAKDADNLLTAVNQKIDEANAAGAEADG